MTEIVTGTDLLRAALRQRAFKGSLSLIARDCHTDAGSLDAFARGAANKLPVDTLKALAKYLFDANYDPEADRLRNAIKHIPTPLGTVPGPCPPGPKWPSGPHVGLFAPGPPVPPKAKRPGWVE